MPTPLSIPDPATRHPIATAPSVVFLKAVVDAPNVEIGDYSYYDDPVEPERFYEKCVRYHFPFLGDRLVIGRFVAIATGATFIMNGANHMMGGFSTYPFAIFGGAFAEGFDFAEFAEGLRGDTVVGNDVWIGTHATIMPGVAIGDGAIVGAHAVVATDVPPYAEVVGNPARVIRQRFAPEVVDALQAIAWWNWPVERIARHRRAIVGADLAALRAAAMEDGS